MSGGLILVAVLVGSAIASLLLFYFTTPVARTYRHLFEDQVLLSLEKLKKKHEHILNRSFKCDTCKYQIKNPLPGRSNCSMTYNSAYQNDCKFNPRLQNLYEEKKDG